MNNIQRIFSPTVVALAVLSLAAPTCLADDENLAMYKQWDKENAAGRRAYESMRYGEAATLYEKALATAEKLQYRGPLGTSSYDLARCYHKMRLYPQAEAHYKQAIEYFDSSRGSYYLGTCVQDYADLLRETGRSQEAGAEEARLKVSPRLDKVKQSLNAQNGQYSNGQSSSGQSSANSQPYWKRQQYSSSNAYSRTQGYPGSQSYPGGSSYPNSQPNSNAQKPNFSGPQPYSYGPYSSNMFKNK